MTEFFLKTALNPKQSMLFHCSSISIWSVLKKKPTFTLKYAHSVQRDEPESNIGTAATTAEENWITSLAALQNSDLIASGRSE